MKSCFTRNPVLSPVDMAKYMTEACLVRQEKLDKIESDKKALSSGRTIQTQLTRETNSPISQMWWYLSKQVKRVQTRLKRLQGLDQAGGEKDDSETDSEDDEPHPVRCGRTKYDEHHQRVSYEGKAGAVGVCQFLQTPVSIKLNYFEVLVADYGKCGRIAVGFARRNYPLNKMPGWKEGSVAFHCDSGKLFHGDYAGTEMADSAQQGDVIGCGIRYDYGSKGSDDNVVVFFTRNGEEIGNKRVKIPKGRFYPIVGLNSEGEQVEVYLNARWESADNADYESQPDTVWKEATPRMTQDCLQYDEQTRRLKYTSRDQQVAIFQDLSRPVTKHFTFFEVTLIDMGLKGSISIGFANSQYPLYRMPGLDCGSVAYHCDEGKVFKGLPNQSTFSPAKRNEVIGCGVRFSPTDRKRAKVFFTRDNVIFEDYETNIPIGGLYPTIGMVSPGEEVEINFEAKWPPQDFRSRRVYVKDDVIKHVGCNFDCVGVYQSLSHPMNEEFSYYEVTVKDYGRKGRIGVGLARRDYPLNKQPGWLKGSIGWHCDNGGLYIASLRPGKCRSPAKEGDVIGCGVDYKETKKLEQRQNGSHTDKKELVVFFTLNGEILYQEKIREPKGGLFPTVGMQSRGEVAQMNMSAVWKAAAPADILSIEASRGQRVGAELHLVQGFPVPRLERVQIRDHKVSYDPDEFMTVGAFQLSREITADHSFFEVCISKFGTEGLIGVGLAPKDYPLYCQPGSEPGSIGYHCDDGCLYLGAGLGTATGVKGRKGDKIVCGVDYTKGKGMTDNKVVVFFTHNGSRIIELLWELPRGGLFPTIGLNSSGAEIEVIKDGDERRSNTYLINKETRV